MKTGFEHENTLYLGCQNIIADTDTTQYTLTPRKEIEAHPDPTAINQDFKKEGGLCVHLLVLLCISLQNFTI